MDRRRFLTLAGAAGLAATAGALTAAGGSSAAGASPGDRPTGRKKKRPVKLGFIALTDCASLVMAQELGYFAARGLDVTLEKQASWPATRDALLNDQIDGAHCLFSLPLAVATGIGGTAGDTSLKIAMVLSNNGQAITLNKDFASVGYGNLAKARKALESKPPTLAMTFPGGTHDTWLRYWLKAAKVDAAAVKIIPIPPAQMVANMKVGAMDGYCVGEPWNAVAVDQGIGFTHLASQDIWADHPEKALVVNERFAADKTAVLKDVMAAVLDASRWLDARSHGARTAAAIGASEYVNAPPDDIEGRLEGRYELGAGLGTKTFKSRSMTFFGDGSVNAPRRAHALWFLAQYQRFGLLDDAPRYRSIVDDVLLRDLYEDVATSEGIAVPADDMKPFTVRLDHARFDPAKPQQEANRP